MKNKVLILVGLFLLFIIYLLPARLFESYLPSDRNLAVSGLNGRLWSGEISSILVQQTQFNQIKFSINPLALVIGNLSTDIKIPKGDIKGELSILLDSDYQNKQAFSDVNLTTKASLFEKFIPLNQVLLSGDVGLSELALDLEQQKPVFLEGNLSWKKAAVSYAGKQWQLGDFELETETNDKKQIKGKLRKSNNKIGLEGEFTLEPSGLFEFVGSISTESEQALYQAFALFNDGKPANGRLPIKFKQKVL